MNRRSFLALPAAALAQAQAVSATSVRLFLKHTWTTTMSSSDYRDTAHLLLTRDGVTGTGEGAPIVLYSEDAASAVQAILSVRDHLASADLRAWRTAIAQVHGRIQGQWAAKAAIDIAVMDWAGRHAGLPLWRLFGLDRRDAPLTTFSIGIDTPEITRQKVREAEQYPILKIKVGLATDEATLDAVRSVTKKPLRVDANEGWKTREEAVRKINWLESQGVEFVEQPMPAHMLEEMNWVRSRVHIPVIADEVCLRPADVPKLAGYFDGVNIKLDKCGGIVAGLRMIETARALGLKTMLGCMISSSVAITAAAQISPLVDWADLDGNLLIRNDPYEGVRVAAGRLILPDRPGLGLIPRSSEPLPPAVP